MGDSNDKAVARDLDALRQGAGVSFLDDRAILAARGSDRATFLHGMLSNEVAKLPPGKSTPALLLSEQGKVVGALRVHVLDDEIWLDVRRTSRDEVRRALERFVVADDVELEDRGAAAVALRGPRSAEVIARAADGGGGVPVAVNEIGTLEPDSSRELSVRGMRLRCVRCRDFGSEAFHLWCDDQASAEIALQALLAAGAAPVGESALEALRIESGTAREAVDFDAATLASEVPSLAASISFKKGCYLGQEVVERVAARGHVNWLLAALRADGDHAPEAGAPVFADEQEVGRVTSAARLPGTGAIVMLARVKRAVATPGTALAVGEGRPRLEASVAEPPVAHDVET